jgi:hypothetical protein
VDRSAAVGTIRRTMKNEIESATNITSGVGGRRATLANEETTIAAIKSGIVAVAVAVKASLAHDFTSALPWCVLINNTTSFASSPAVDYSRLRRLRIF